jgi:D-aminopeptidase
VSSRRVGDLLRLSSDRVARIGVLTESRGFLSAADLGLALGRLRPGPENAITDVEGVAVGHETVTDDSGSVQTGVTVVVPHQGNVFREKLIAACHVINGFGKTTGLVQVDELGQLESPIALTNTFSIPAVTEGLLDFLLDENPEIGATTGTVNTVVAECNDAFLNDLRGRHVRREHVARALAATTTEKVEQGAVGAGRGMSAFGLKGGIGTASRCVPAHWSQAIVGVLVLSNLCQLRELVIAGRPVGAWLAAERGEADSAQDGEPDSARNGGSVIVVVATDAPVSSRQLKRLLHRVQNGLARTGSTTAHGSGEIVIGFSTTARIAHFGDHDSHQIMVLREESAYLDPLFQAVSEATEEAILNSLFNAETVVGRGGACYEGFPIERLEEFTQRALDA